MTKNIFLSLGRPVSSQNENFLTEALVYLLNYLVERGEPSVLVVLKNLFGEKCESWFSSFDNISIDTQHSIVEGRPDIVLKGGEEKIAFIEVKHDSNLGHNQLERYYGHLKASKYKEYQLVLLTRSRHSIQEISLAADKFHHVCWYEISGWLSELNFKDEIATYLVNHFSSFFQKRK